MKKLGLRALSFAIAFVMTIFLFATCVFGKILLGTHNGKCGENVACELDMDANTLTISGSGDMWDYPAYHDNINEVPLFKKSPYLEHVKNIVVRDGITSIGNHAFWNNNYLKNVYISASVIDICQSSFASCLYLEKVDIANGRLENICDNAFSTCVRLAYINLPDNLKTIGDGAFWGCRNLTNIDIPNGVTSIGDAAFSSCSLTSIDIPNSVTSIGDAAFNVGSSLESITVADGNLVYHSDGNCLIETGSKTLIAGCKNSIISADGSVTSIGVCAFDGCSSLTSIEIPSSVTNIGGCAFSDCNSLTDVYYSGTKEQWDSIVIDEIGNEPLLNATIHFGSDDSAQSNIKAYIKMNNGFGNESYTDEVVWQDSWFNNRAPSYNHDLAIASMALSGAAYVDKNEKSVQRALSDLDFTNLNSTYIEPTNQNNDIVSYTFGAKPIGENNTLIVIVIKGTSSDEEWYSNFNIGRNGTEHSGFSKAADKLLNGDTDNKSSVSFADYIESLKKQGYNVDKDNTKILVTGHSRGAAVANLVAARLTNSEYAYRDNVYGYTFATPNVEVGARAKGLYNNIFNIVSGEDFVTQVPLSYWGFSRYGIDLLLPSKSYYSSKKYSDIFDSMEIQFKTMTGKEFAQYGGTKAVDDLTYKVFNMAETIDEYYEKKHMKNSLADFCTVSEYFYELAGVLSAEPKSLDQISKISDFALTFTGEFSSITSFFVYQSKVKERIDCAHCMATYYSWLKSCDASELFGSANSGTYETFKRIKIACPVDVFVYDEKEELVASVVNEDIVCDKIAVYAENGEKTIDLPLDQEYFVEVKAREQGEVSYSIKELSAEATGVRELRIVETNNIQIEAGDILTGVIDDSVYTDVSSYALIKNNETVVNAEKDSMRNNPFEDVAISAWYYSAVEYVYNHSLMKGMTETTFEPDNTTTRAMLVTVMYRMEGEPRVSGNNPFTDVEHDWYKDAVAWAYENKIVNGTTETTFAPMDDITREQMATILYRYSEFRGYDISPSASLDTFPDGGDTSDYAIKAMSWAVAEGLITGSNEGGKTLLVPKGNATRAQIATILMRFCEKH